MNDNKATLLGATGLVGGHILNALIKDKTFTSITILVRRKVDLNHPKVKEVIVDFKDRKAFLNAIEPKSIIFCAIGTTNKKVKGDKAKYRSIDYDIPVNAAKFGLKLGCEKFILVSSVGANSQSSNFYTKLKGEVEEKISRLGYPNLYFFRSSLLLGKRKEHRLGEQLAKTFMLSFSLLLPSKIKPIQAKDVAKAMVKVSRQEESKDVIQIYHYNSIIHLARDNN